MSIKILRFLSGKKRLHNGILTQIWKIAGWNFYPAIFQSYKVMPKFFFKVADDRPKIADFGPRTYIGHFGALVQTSATLVKRSLAFTQP